MDPVTMGLLASTAISSLFGGMNANSTAQDNLSFQRQNAADQLKFAKAGRTDAFGNTTSFDDALNKWITQLTPMQQNLIKAGEHEQLQGLTHDAGQNRAVRDQQYRRGIQAGEDYNTARAGYQYDQPKSEGANFDELVRLITNARGTGDRATAQLADRQSLRQHGNMPVINTGNPADRNYPGHGYAGDRLAQTILQARQQALGETTQRDQAHASKYLPAMRQFAETASQGGNAPFSFSTTPDRLGAQQQQLDQLLQGALKGGSSAVQGAETLQAKTNQNQFGDPSDYIKMIAALKGGQGRVGAAAGATGNYGGSPSTNSFLNPSTYGNRPFDFAQYGPRMDEFLGLNA